MIEKNIHERYDLGGLERIRPRPEGFPLEERPTATATYVDPSKTKNPGAPGAGYLRAKSPLRTKIHNVHNPEEI